MTNDYSLDLARPYVPFDPFADPDGFPLCCLSKRTIFYSCGMIARKDDVIKHAHPAGELKLCQRLAAAAAKVVKGLEIGMGSEGTPAIIESKKPIVLTESFYPFFVAANEREQRPKKMSAALIRERFGGVIFSECKVRVEPLLEKGRWWKSVLHWYSDYPKEEQTENLKPWRKMMAWFHAQKDFQDVAFVMIGDGPEHGGAHFPRLAVGLTKAGSLAGVVGVVVHT